MEIDHEIISTAILLLLLIQEGLLSVASESMWVKYWFSCKQKYVTEVLVNQYLFYSP